MLLFAHLGEVAVFDTHIRATSGKVVHFDGALMVMDLDLLDESIDAMKRERTTAPRSDAITDAQWVWDDYCRRHLARHGERFVPDESPSWLGSVDFFDAMAEIDLFDSQVVARCGNVFPFGRTFPLMSGGLLRETIEAMVHERDTRARPDARYDAQWVWRHYCERHFERRGQHFVPDVDPTWRGAKQTAPNAAAPTTADAVVQARPINVFRAMKEMDLLRAEVFAQSGNVFEFGRASPLMDKHLLRETIEAMVHERDTRPREDAKYDTQWVWEEYCERHLEHYGDYFIPDVSPTWRGEDPPASEPLPFRPRPTP